MFPHGVEALVELLQRVLTPYVPDDEEWYNWQTLSLTAFYTGMEEVRRKLGRGRFRFLDVGSGIGTKLYLADTLGFEPYGIERVPQYARVSRTLFPEYPVHEGNVLEFDALHQFHVIYSYRIAKDPEDQKRVDAHIDRYAQSGAIRFLIPGDELPSKQPDPLSPKQ